MKIVNGWAFPDEDEFMAGEMKADGRYQYSHLTGSVQFCNQKCVAIDGGAHIGTWSKILAGMFEKVIAFEPSKDTYECLIHNVGNLSNIDFHNQALGKEPGQIKMTLEGFQKAIDLKNTGARFTRDGGDIERITIDSLNLPVLDYLKLDIEGGEVDALLGAKETLKRCKPIVLFEDKNLWKRYGYSRNKPHEILTKLGAKKLVRLSMDEVWGW